MDNQGKNKQTGMEEDCPLCNVSAETLQSLKQGSQNKAISKKQVKEMRRAQIAKRRKIKRALKIYLPITVGAILLVVFSVLLAGGSQSLAKIEISQPKYDAGTVSMADGLVEHIFEIKNIGEENLKISKIWTSCMCTTASLKVGDKESNFFGMHDSGLFWSEELAPGQTGFLKVVFDPAFHGPSGTGNMLRKVYLATNDTNNKKVEVAMFINVKR